MIIRRSIVTHGILSLLATAALLGTAFSAAAAPRMDLVQRSIDFLAAETALTPENCATSLPAAQAALTGFASRDVTRADLVRAAAPAIENLWRARLELRDRMTEFARDGRLDAACVSALRRAYRGVRYLEEYLAVHALKPGAWVDPQPSDVFSGGFPAMLTRTGASERFELQTGDVLVSYGMAYGSAAIAHIGDDPGSFSHMALVYVDPKSVIYTIEAHPEFGVKVAEISKYMRDGKGRAALYRHRDPKLAARAARRMFDLASRADWSGHPIPYDFAMNIHDRSKLFCTEVVEYAYSIASRELGRNVTVPANPTRISMRSTYILDSFDIADRTMFAPSDIEVDPQFELLAEWRDVARVRLMHHQQAALQKEFRWLDDLDYRYHDTLESSFDTDALFTLRHLPLFSGFVDQMVPPDLSHKALQAVANVYLTSDQIHDRLIKQDQTREKLYGTLQTEAEILRSVEMDRVADLETYRAYRRWLKYDRFSGDPAPSSDSWHKIFRADSADEDL